MLHDINEHFKSLFIQVGRVLLTNTADSSCSSITTAANDHQRALQVALHSGGPGLVDLLSTSTRRCNKKIAANRGREQVKSLFN